MDGPHNIQTRRKSKRKRTSSASTTATSSNAIINPLSHPPDTLRQFAVAGYPIDQPLPSKAYPGFPHRAGKFPWACGEANEAAGDSDSDQGRPTTSARKGKPRAAAAGGGEAGDADVDTNPSGPSDIDDVDATSSAGWLTTDGEGETTADESTTPSATRRRAKSKSQHILDRRSQAYRARVGAVEAIVRRCLEEGDIVTARRAFGLLARAKVYGRKVDLRWERIWEMGAEVLMREGEEMKRRRRRQRKELDDEGEEGEGVKKEKEEGEEDVDGEKQGEAESEEDEHVAETRFSRLKAYYEYLIQQYPYTKQHAARSGPSAVDFHVALFSTEMEAVHSAHARGLARLERGDDDDYDDNNDNDNIDNEDNPNPWNPDNIDIDNYNNTTQHHHHDTMDLDPSSSSPPGPANNYGLRLTNFNSSDHEDTKTPNISAPPQPGPTFTRHLRRQNALRLTALRRMLSIAERMDTAMEAVPFSRDPEMLRLRAMVALYIADLQVPPSSPAGLGGGSGASGSSGRRERARERRRARDLLRRIKEAGGRLGEGDEALLRGLEQEEEEEEQEDGYGEGGGGGMMGLEVFSSMDMGGV
ncbi:hypothetical protein VTJ04DRAFT_4524 [Mycothermus thermophilus]|uniref:uncharacterized protein n=1 Tax=Humicola insolens TaxID=85995 RepID=UPI0037428E60